MKTRKEIQSIMVAIIFQMILTSCSEKSQIGECYAHSNYAGLKYENIPGQYFGKAIDKNDRFTVIQDKGGSVQYLMLNTFLGFGNSGWIKTNCPD